jgi:hypothetical protein
MMCKTMSKGGITFMHVNTETLGKESELDIGNTTARQSGHAIVMFADAGGTWNQTQFVSCLCMLKIVSGANRKLVILY